MSLQNKQFRQQAAKQKEISGLGLFFLIVIGIILLLAALTGCVKTYAPPLVQSRGASYDGADRNSGFIDFTTNVVTKKITGGILTPHGRDRYNGLILVYGGRFSVPLQTDSGIAPTTTNTYLIDAQHLRQYMKMEDWRRQTNTAPNLFRTP